MTEPVTEAGSREDDDAALAVRLVQGDAEALRAIHRRYSPKVFGIALRALDETAADEIVQDVFVSAWQHRATYEPSRGTLKSWLFAIARNRMLTELKRRRRHPAAPVDPDELDTEDIHQLAADELQWETHRRTTLRAAVDALPPPQARALALAFFDDLTHQQVASTLGVPLGTAKTRIRKGLQQLATVLAALMAVAVVFVFVRRERSARDVDRRALAMVTSSDVVPLRMVAAPGVPIEAHGNYRAHAADDIAVVTVSHLSAAPAGVAYVLWSRRASSWHRLGSLSPDSAGHAMLVVQDRSVSARPDALEVTLDANEAPAPSGRVILEWPGVVRPP